jgi:hypothetical protein
MSVLTGLPVEDLEEMFPNEKTKARGSYGWYC